MLFFFDWFISDFTLKRCLTIDSAKGNPCLVKSKTPEKLYL